MKMLAMSDMLMYNLFSFHFLFAFNTQANNILA